MRLSYHSIRHKYQTYAVHAYRAHFMPHLGQAHNAAYAESVQYSLDKVVPTVEFLATTVGYL